MMRHCDGKDPNLVRKVGDDWFVDGAYVPCDCGLSFDDVDRSVVHPHVSVVVNLNAVRMAIADMPDGELKDELTRHLVGCEDVQAFRSYLIGRAP